MRSVVFLALLALLCGCGGGGGGDDDSEPSLFMGSYSGTCVRTWDGNPDSFMEGIIEGTIDSSGDYSGMFTFHPGVFEELYLLHGHIARSGQFTGEEQMIGMDPLDCTGTVTLTDVGIDGDIINSCGDPPEVERLRFTMTRQ